MKKAFLNVLFACFCTVCMGQSGLIHYNNNNGNTYNKYKVDADFGIALPTGAQPGGTLVLTVEPQYRLSDANEIGLRVQDAFLRQVNNSNLSGFSVSSVDSYCLTAEHYFSNKMFRPLIGVGGGAFRQGAVINSTFPSQSIAAQTHLGVFPRLGFEIGVLRFTAEYNIMGANSNNTNPSYFSINGGFFFGGGGNDRR